MDNNTKYEHLKFLMERFDHYYDSINNKGAFYIGLNTFLLGGICVGYIAYHEKITNNYLFLGLIFAMMACCIVSILYTILAIRPYTKDNHVNDDCKSLIFFGGIADHTANFFFQKFDSETEDSILTDMKRQVHCLAVGLNVKYKRLKYASMLLLAQFCTLLSLFFLTTKIL